MIGRNSMPTLWVVDAIERLYMLAIAPRKEAHNGQRIKGVLGCSLGEVGRLVAADKIVIVTVSAPKWKTTSEAAVAAMNRGEMSSCRRHVFQVVKKIAVWKDSWNCVKASSTVKG